MKNNVKKQTDWNKICKDLRHLDGAFLLLIEEVAAYLQVSLRTVQRRCHSGQLHYVKVKRAVRITVEELLYYIDSHVVTNG